MYTESLINSKGNPTRHVNILITNTGDELLVHYGTPIAGRIGGVYVKTNRFHSVTSSKHINTYLSDRTHNVVDQLYLDSVLAAV